MHDYPAVKMLEEHETYLDQLLVIGRPKGGVVSIFTDNSDVGAMLLLMERAKKALVDQMESQGDAV